MSKKPINKSGKLIRGHTGSRSTLLAAEGSSSSSSSSSVSTY
jgi:hypothetical protein